MIVTTSNLWASGAMRAATGDPAEISVRLAFWSGFIAVHLTKALRRHNRQARIWSVSWRYGRAHAVAGLRGRWRNSAALRPALISAPRQEEGRSAIEFAKLAGTVASDHKQERKVDGGAGRDRTDDLSSAIAALSQLSYGPRPRHLGIGVPACQATAETKGAARSPCPCRRLCYMVRPTAGGL